MLYEEFQESKIIKYSLYVAVVLAAIVSIQLITTLPDMGENWEPYLILIFTFGSSVSLLLVTQKLHIQIDSSQVSYGMGPFKGSVAISEIEQVRIVKLSMWTAGGWGIRYTLGGRWNWIAVMAMGVEIDTKSGKKRGFSTDNPDKIKAVLEQLLPGKVTDTRT